MNAYKTIAALAILGMGALWAHAENVDALVAKLGGDDEVARSYARQLLPRGDASAVSKVIPLLENPKPEIWNAAFNVLSDFANEVNVPGRENDRAYVTNQLMTLVAPKKSPEMKVLGLKLLAIVVPEGYNVAPVAALLSDETLRENARASLQEMETEKAARALAKALRKADPAFQCALLDSLGLMQDRRSLRTIRSYAKSDDAKVRAAAARALSWTGEGAYFKSVESVYAAHTPETAFDAADAMVRFADAAVRTRGDRSTATAIYKRVLTTSSNSACRGAAIVGLVRHGDDTVLPVIIEAMKGSNGRDLEPALLTALGNAGNDALKAKIVEALPHLAT